MKKMVFLVFLLGMVPSLASAAAFVSVTPIMIKKMPALWEYEFSFKRSVSSKPEIVHVEKSPCKVLKTSSGKPFWSVSYPCFDKEADARVSAKKDADAFEARVQKGDYK